MKTYKYQAWMNIKNYHRSIPVQCGKRFDTIEEARDAAFVMVEDAHDNVNLLDGGCVTPTMILVTQNDSDVWSKAL